MEIINFLPLHCAKFSIGREFSQEELSVVKEHRLNTYNNIGNITSRETRILDKHLTDLKSKVEGFIKQYTDEIIIPQQENFKLKITQSWLNYTEPGQYHHSHSHPNSIVSGVIYFNAIDKDRIEFYSNNQDREILIPTKTYTPNNSQSWWVPVKAGDVILFPSNLKHSVPKTISSDIRISLAFNTFVDGELGSVPTLTHLNVNTISSEDSIVC